MEEKKRKLYRSRSDAILGGVCGGLGAYLGVDANIVRLVFLLLLLASGTGLLVYLALWLLVPQEGAQPSPAEQRLEEGAQEIAAKARELSERVRNADRPNDAWVALAIGIALVAIGAVVLLHNLGLPALWWIRWGVVWPVVLILIGLALLLRQGRRR